MDEYTKEERMLALERMRQASNGFYGAAVRTGVHTFIEFTGLINEFIVLCEAAEAAGNVSWLMSSTHLPDNALPLEEHHVDYLAEKLDCIYGPGLRENKLLERLLR